MNACAFSRYFTAKVGISFTALLRAMRIERALAQLEAQDRPIGDLAEENGYQSGCTFARAFKSVVGTTPSEYRRRVLFGEIVSEV
jgi:AraC-like DNA-binding protein